MALLVHFEGQGLEAFANVIRQIELLVTCTHALVLVISLLFVELNLELARFALVLLDLWATIRTLRHLVPDGTLSLENIFFHIFRHVVDAMGAVAHVVDLVFLLSDAGIHR